ncbi:DnaD domain protein [Exiguobacterium sp. s5]|uniref:DnaD domain protein n=1 Tax=Exiguobacterium sp. s5 TaxID=2751239 RepID=UPI001BEC7018|nr:DnaD domain protein [Exiguobacterium sp. s5]
MGNERIHRVLKENNFVMLDKGFLANTNLSLKAKGLLAYVLSLPDDWIIYTEEITKHHKDGKAAVLSAFKELEEQGHVKRERVRDTNGQLKGYKTTVYETPLTENRLSEVGKTEVGKTEVGKSSTTKNYSTKNDFTKNDLTKVSTTTGVNEFQQLADIYTSKINQNLQAVHEFLEDDLNEFGLDLLTEAINEAALANIRNYKYVRAILSGWKDRGVTTLQGVIQDRADFEEKKQSQQKRKSWSPTKETAMKNTPEWLEKDAEEQRAYEQRKRDELAASVPDDKELEKLLAEMRGGA